MVKKHMLRKSTFREIGHSFSRWVAILSIVALGVGFFSGLKVTKEAFHTTLNEYVNESNFFDFELLSTIGIDEDDIKEISLIDGIKDVEGSYSTDIIYSVVSEDDESGNEENVCKLHAITKDINVINLVSGTMPSNDSECVVDSGRFSEEAIGKYIVFTDSNDEDRLNLLKNKKYKIVGLIDSPLYLNFERGSTSLGNGQVNCYIYINSSAFVSDYYTEAYITCDNRGFVFSEEYENNMDSMENIIDDSFSGLVINRYDDLISEANDEIASHEKEIEDGKSKLLEAEVELNNNKEKLEDAKEEIEEGEKKLEDGRTELDSYWESYNEGLASYEAAYNNLSEMFGKEVASSMLTDEKLKLDSTYNMLIESEKELKNREDEINEGKSQIIEAEEKIADGEKEIEEAKKEIADGEEKLKEAKEELEKLDESKTYTLSRSTNIGYACFESDSSIVEGVAKVFPLFFFLVATLVVMTTMSRMVNDERTQIGILKALGYSKGQILGKYLFYSNSAALLGGIFGFIVGSYLFPYVIWTAYGIMYGFSDLVPVFNYKLGTITTLSGVLCVTLSTIYSCYNEMKEVPAELIRPKAPQSGKKVLLEKITFIWKRMPFLHKVSARNIFRYKKRFIMMIVGICGCTALLVTGLGISDSIKNVVSKQYDDILTIDYEVSLSDDFTEDDEDSLLLDNGAYIEDAMFVYSISMDCDVNGQTKSINLVVIDENDEDDMHKFINLHDENNSELCIPNEGECIVNYSFLERNNLTIGDSIILKDSDLNELNLKIVSACENYIYNYVYVSKTTYENSIGSYVSNTVLVRGIEGHDYNIDGGKLGLDDRIVSVSIIESFRNRVDKMMKAMDLVVLLVVFSAGALAFIVLYNLTNINISERIGEIATLKVLGFYPRETSAYVSRENYVLTTIAAIIGLPLGKWLHLYVMNQIKIDLVSFDIHVDISSYIIAFVLTIAFAILVNLFMRVKLNKIDMAESMKSIE